MGGFQINDQPSFGNNIRDSGSMLLDGARNEAIITDEYRDKFKYKFCRTSLVMGPPQEGYLLLLPP